MRGRGFRNVSLLQSYAIINQSLSEQNTPSPHPQPPSQSPSTQHLDLIRAQARGNALGRGPAEALREQQGGRSQRKWPFSEELLTETSEAASTQWHGSSEGAILCIVGNGQYLEQGDCMLT